MKLPACADGVLCCDAVVGRTPRLMARCSILWSWRSCLLPLRSRPCGRDRPAALRRRAAAMSSFLDMKLCCDAAVWHRPAGCQLLCLLPLWPSILGHQHSVQHAGLQQPGCAICARLNGRERCVPFPFTNGFGIEVPVCLKAPTPFCGASPLPLPTHAESWFIQEGV